MAQACLLIILDGWGIGKGDHTDAIASAQTPNYDNFLQNNPNATLTTFGPEVGLPEGQMGNSEVGHLNIGAGRIVYQNLMRINKSIESGEFFSLNSLLEHIERCKQHNNRLHLIGLISDGGVHSHLSHTIAMAKLAQQEGVKEVYIHAFTDGRDCSPDSAIQHINQLEESIQQLPNVHLATITGRYFGMDRDSRWERVKVAYDAMVHRVGSEVPTFSSAIEERYQVKEFDEFIQPLINPNCKQSGIHQDDSIVFVNFRTDRCKQLLRALHEDNLSDYQLPSIPNLNVLSFVEYDQVFNRTHVAFPPQFYPNTLGEWLSKKGKSQIRLAETEKFPHVTSFFNGTISKPYPLEDRMMSKSPNVPTYDYQPEMSALEVKENVLNAIQSKKFDFICVNFANTDMVGHTGIFHAAVSAAEAVDSCLGEILDLAAQEHMGTVIIADHGNADIMINSDGSPHTAHTINPVPVIINAKGVTKISSGKLADIAPTVLNILGVEQAPEMTGKTLIQS